MLCIYIVLEPKRMTKFNLADFRFAIHMLDEVQVRLVEGSDYDTEVPSCDLPDLLKGLGAESSGSYPSFWIRSLNLRYSLFLSKCFTHCEGQELSYISLNFVQTSSRFLFSSRHFHSSSRDAQHFSRSDLDGKDMFLLQGSR